MKKYVLLLATVMMMVILSACGEGSSSEASDEETIVLKAGSNLPSNHLMMEFIMNPMMEYIEEETDGKVKFEVYDSESLVRAGEELEALRSGTIDIAIPMYDVYDVTRFPFAEVALLPTLDSNTEINAEAMKIFSENEEPLSNGDTLQETVYGSQDLIGWSTSTGPSYTIGSIGDPIESLSDLTSMQIRVSSNMQEILANNLGASPVNISINETFDAFNRGTLDGGFTVVPDWESYGFDEVFTYAIDGINAGTWPSTIAMTEDRFNELPEDVQEVINKAASEIPSSEEAVKNVLQLEEDTLATFADNGGIYQDVNELPDEVLEKVDEAITETWLEWIDNVSKKDDLAMEIALRWRDALIEAGGEVPTEIEELELN